MSSSHLGDCGLVVVEVNGVQLLIHPTQDERLASRARKTTQIHNVPFPIFESSQN